MKLVLFKRPDEGDYRDLAISIGVSILMKLRLVVVDLSRSEFAKNEFLR
jgi:hypothetical protein